MKIGTKYELMLNTEVADFEDAIAVEKFAELGTVEMVDGERWLIVHHVDDGWCNVLIAEFYCSSVHKFGDSVGPLYKPEVWFYGPTWEGARHFFVNGGGYMSYPEPRFFQVIGQTMQKLFTYDADSERMVP